MIWRGDATLKYTTEEALFEIMRRSEKLVIRRNRRVCRMLSGLSGMLLAVLVLVIALLPGTAAAPYSGSVYGSFLLSPEAGGYVLAAVIAFVLGIVTTLLCLKIRNKRKAQSFNSSMIGRK